MNPGHRARGDPGHFALVMATGIVAVASHLLEFRALGWALAAVAVIAYAVLWVPLVIRLRGDWRGLVIDLGDYRHGPGFFALVAGSCVLGNALVVVAGDHLIALSLWWLAIALWIVFVYGFFAGMMTRAEKAGIESIHGGWLTVAVATQAISILGTLLAAGEPAGEQILFFSLLMHLLGCALYAGLVLLILRRLLFAPLAPEEFRAPYWINAGGAAVSSLAGATLVVHAPEAFFLGQLLPFLKGLMLLFWVIASWWLPLLVILALWRSAWRRVPVVYDPNWWDAVFPLGMYTVATFELSQAESSLPFLLALARTFLHVALAAWAVAFAGMLVRAFRRPRRD